MWNREEDLKEWQNIEDKFIELLQQRNPWATIEQQEWYFTDYDLKLIKKDGTEITFEIKYDRMCGSTGNVAVEFSYDGRPSGIYKSTADYIVYYLEGIFRCSKTQELIQKLEWYTLIEWWDWLKSKLMLIPYKIFTTYCISL